MPGERHAASRGNLGNDVVPEIDGNREPDARGAKTLCLYPSEGQHSHRHAVTVPEQRG
jgi:hypothetical protein